MIAYPEKTKPGWLHTQAVRTPKPIAGALWGEDIYMATDVSSPPRMRLFRIDRMTQASNALDQARQGLAKGRLYRRHRAVFEAVVAEGLTPRLPRLIEERWRRLSFRCACCDRDVVAVACIHEHLGFCHDCVVQMLALVPEPVELAP